MKPQSTLLTRPSKLAESEDPDKRSRKLRRSGRVIAHEFMDLGPEYYSEQEYFDMLYKLGTINKLLGGDRATFSAIKKLNSIPESILDVGCGAGRSTIELAQKFPQTHVVGIDIEQPIINYAQSVLDQERKSGKKLENLSFEYRSCAPLQEPEKSFDIVMCTLVCHHMSDEQIIDFLQRARSIAKKAIIINDLHRSPYAVALYSLIAPLFRNRLITYDGTVSILRSFIKQDWEYYLKEAGYSQKQYCISRHFAYRWIVTIGV